MTLQLADNEFAREGYYVVFSRDRCIISDNQTQNQIITIQRTKNNMFPLDISNIGRLNVVVIGQNPVELWHFRFGHLNYRSLQILAQKKIWWLESQNGNKIHHLKIVCWQSNQRLVFQLG